MWYGSESDTPSFTIVHVYDNYVDPDENTALIDTDIGTKNGIISIVTPSTSVVTSSFNDEIIDT